MTTAVPKSMLRASPDRAMALLENGARFSRPMFHAVYKRTPEDFKAELIGGIVFRRSGRVTFLHGSAKARIVGALGLYVVETQGVEALCNVTLLIGDESEPEPDAVCM